MVILQSRKTILIAAFMLLSVIVTNLIVTVSPVLAAVKDVVDGIDVGSPTNDVHYWGNCQVQDYNGGPYGWVIVSYGYNTPNQYPVIYTSQTGVVRNGMLYGWFDNGGATGSLGCPTGDEYSYMNGERQDFQGGSLYWVSGMDHAALIDPNREGAMSWAWSYKGQSVWVGQCLWFAVHAYWFGENNWKLNGPYGDTVRAVDWWNQAAAPQHPGDTNPPRGALVFWDYWAGGTGHAALSLGGGWVISTEFGGDYTIHTFKISDFPDHYLGWKDPS